MPAAPQIATEAEAFAASFVGTTDEIATVASNRTPAFHLGDAVAGAIGTVMGFYSLAFLGHVLLVY